MKELDKTYNPSEIEGRIYDKWMGGYDIPCTHGAEEVAEEGVMT